MKPLTHFNSPVAMLKDSGACSKDLETALFIAADLVQTHGERFLPAFLAIEALANRQTGALERVAQVLRARQMRSS